MEIEELKTMLVVSSEYEISCRFTPEQAKELLFYIMKLELTVGHHVLQIKKLKEKNA